MQPAPLPPDPEPDRAPDREPDRAPDRVPGRTPDRTPDRVPGRTPDREHSLTPEQAAELVRDHVAAHGLDGIGAFITDHKLAAVSDDRTDDDGAVPTRHLSLDEVYDEWRWETEEELIGHLLHVALRSFRAARPPPSVLAAAVARLSVALDGEVRTAPAPLPVPLPDITRPDITRPERPNSDTDAFRLSSFVADTFDGCYHDHLAPFGLSGRQAPTPSEWVGVILGLERSGPGAVTSPQSFIADIDFCPLLTGPPTGENRVRELTAFFGLLLPAWECAGVVERDDQGVARLTGLGTWVLARAANLAWGY